MNLYHSCIAVAPKKIGAEMRYTIALACLTGSLPRPRSASGTFSQNSHTCLFSLSGSVEGTRSVAQRGGAGVTDALSRSTTRGNIFPRFDSLNDKKENTCRA